jgi:rod shape-determining protein MreC
VSLAEKAKDKAKKNPTWLLGVLLGVHLLAVSLNRVPGQPNLWIVQVVLSTIIAPAQSVMAHGWAGVTGIWSDYFSMRDSRIENERLRAERSQVETELIDLREKVKLFEQVDALREMQADNKYAGVQALVIARDANQLFNTVLIDKGSTSGVAKDQPVVTVEGLVGRVINAWPLSAQVLLITDERHGAGAIIGQTEDNRLLGVVRGRKDYFCEMRFIAPSGKVENGEPVITSGQDGIYPRGLLIGRVRRIDGGSAVAPQVVEVEPAAPLGKLETVSVLAIDRDQIRRAIDQLRSEEKKQANAPDRKKK